MVGFYYLWSVESYFFYKNAPQGSGLAMKHYAA
jgi:hypothetical protein